MVHRLEIQINNTDHFLTINYFKDYGYFVKYDRFDYHTKFHVNTRDSIYTLIDSDTVIVSIFIGEEQLEEIFTKAYHELVGELTREEFDKFMDLFESIDVEQNQKLFRQTLISKTKNKITQTLPPELVNQIVKLL